MRDKLISWFIWAIIWWVIVFWYWSIFSSNKWPGFMGDWFRNTGSWQMMGERPMRGSWQTMGERPTGARTMSWQTQTWE